MKIAIVYDWIDKIGGVERLLLTLHEIFPDAEFYTSYYERISAPWAKDLKINTSFIQKLPSFIKKNRILSIPFYPYAFEAFDFSNFDIVISVTSSFAKAVITKPHTKHICILLTPTRYFWQDENSYIKSFFKILAAPIINDLRSWDSIISKRPDKYISISNEVKKRTKKYYQAD
ncbi:MAG TPA: hypothetical protein VK338_05245, partial [Candidatus Nitrosocosmicus sp.]|nr:hypothetical protein [Candidatus Nitrosocosmicus sp.]